MRSHIFLLYFIFISESNARKEPRKQVRTVSDGDSIIEIGVENTQETDRCYQYTWVGVEGPDMNVNGTGSFPSCMDLESDFSIIYGRELPCFAPLVWTVDDENANNRPNVTEIIEACQTHDPPCDPYCLRAGQMCVKYTVTDRNKRRTVSWESSFCGQGTNWEGEVVSANRCFTENKVGGKDHRVCFCDDMSLCNSARKLSEHSVIIQVVILLLISNIF
eukprot:GFUD01003240.1.p1 GENE.GFUD01003240.1~~GFUD01003240.1.p1  ORF type:complete len:219 (+),score=35.85 GFUD01003240.1:7-663(+)